MTDEIADGIEVLQDATRVLAGVALRSLDALEGAVSLPQFRVLAVLGQLGQVRSARVAEALGLEASTVTRLADRLETSGYASRGTDPTNRSAVTLELTDAGRDLVAQVASWRRGELKRILLCLQPGDRAAMICALQALVDVAGEGYGAIPHHPLPL